MIQAFNHFSQSKFAKVFLLLVAASFGVFFGGSNYFTSQGTHKTIAEVDGVEITRSEFKTILEQQREAYQARTGQTLSNQDMFESGIVQNVLHGLIDNLLLDREAKELGLVVSDEDVLRELRSVKAFQNEKGEFDREQFTRVLYASRMNEQTFLAHLKSEMVRDQLKSAIMAGAFVPQILVDALAEADNQIRQGATATITPKDIAKPAAPSDQVLEAFYAQEKDLFMAPELRSFTAIVASPDMMTKEISIAEEDMKAEFEARPDAYKGMTFDAAKPTITKNLTAQMASDKLYTLSQSLEDEMAGGATFEEIAKARGLKVITVSGVDFTGLSDDGETPVSIPGDDALKSDLISTAFQTDEGADSAFTESAGGLYYAVRVDEVQPAQPLEFKVAKERVYKEWAQVQRIHDAHQRALAYVKDIQAGRIPPVMTLLPNLTLSGGSDDQDVMEALFRLSPGQATVTGNEEGFKVVLLKNVIPASPEVIRAKREETLKSTKTHLAADQLQSFLKALRIRYPVVVNEKAIHAALE